MRSLTVFLNDQAVGTLSEGADLWRFAYDAQWAQAPGSFDLTPGLPRTQQLHQDGGSFRPVQWYFDNLLPEETLRQTVSKEAGIKGDDAFALLEYLGAESAGSLVLLPPGEQPSPRNGLQSLSDAQLSQRIRKLPRASLSSGAPKRMSVAGAQHKLLVVYRDGALFEPVGAEPSTHLLKPNHTSDDYPSSVINEYLVLRLAGKLGLLAPAVYRKYVPEPVYLITRFDRYANAAGSTQRRHIIDACQLLNKPRGFKNKAANLQTLSECVDQCRNRASTRLRLYRWLMFNLLVANDDNHLKNISFMVSAEGIDLSPHYDMLSTSVYRTVAFADQRANWPEVEMMIPLPGATHFSQVTRESLLQAAEALGLTRRIGTRELDRMSEALLPALDGLIQDIEHQNAGYGEAVRVFLEGEIRVVRAIRHIVAPYLLERLADPK
jgi:serine/threonine-protein kinase HipA